MTGYRRQKVLLKIVPDLPFFRRSVSRIKIFLVNRHTLPEHDVEAAEEDWIKKYIILENCKKRWPKATSNINCLIDKVFEDIPFYREARNKGNEEYLGRIRSDMIFCYFAYGYTTNEYFAFRLENKGFRERKNFISNRLRIEFRCRMNDLLRADIFYDKEKTYKQFKKYFKREAITVSRPEHYTRFQNFVKKYPVFVKKAVFEAQGRGVELVELNRLNITDKEYFRCLINKGRHILEERIVQSSELAAFNESSVNTVRAITFNTRKGIVVPYCTIRTGRPGSFVDNGGAGGIQACIDFNTGVIITEGYDEYGGKYAMHPGTGIAFRGYQLPEWEQLQKIIKEAASQISSVKFIGWDLAHTRNGWSIVEGNESCFVIAWQMINNQGMKRIFEDIMKDMDLIV